MSASAHKRPISQVACAIVLALLFCFGAVPEIQAGALGTSILRIDFLVGDGLSMGIPFTPERADLENLQVDGGTVYISGNHDGLGNSLVPANRDASLNQRAAELSGSLSQDLPLNAILIDFQGAFDQVTLDINLTGRELMAYQANEGTAFTPEHLVQLTPNVYGLPQFFSHIDRNLETLDKLTLYYSVDFSGITGAEPSETEVSTEPSEEVTEPSEEPTELTEPSEAVTEPPAETTETTEGTSPVEANPEITDETLEEPTSETSSNVTEDPSQEETQESSEEPQPSETPEESSKDPLVTEASMQATEAEDLTDKSIVDPITVILKTPEELALEQVKDELNSLIKAPALQNASDKADTVEAPQVDEITPQPETPTTPIENTENKGVVLLANLPSDPTDPTNPSDPTEPGNQAAEPTSVDPVVEVTATEATAEVVTEPTTTPANPAMETKPSETEPQVMLQAPSDVPASKLDQRFAVLKEATTTLEGYLPTLPEKNAFAARMQQRRIEELITELRSQASTNEHKEILQHAENVLNQSTLKLEIKSTVVLIGATGESLFYSILIGSTLLALGGGLIFLRRRRRFT